MLMTKPLAHQTVCETRFSTVNFPSHVVEAHTRFHVKTQNLVINPSAERMYLGTGGQSIAPFSSLIVINQEIVPSVSAIVIDLPTDVGNAKFNQFSDWLPFKGTIAGNTQEFFRSPKEVLGIYEFNPFMLTQKGEDFGKKQLFIATANFWLAKKGTHCGIHHQHDFIEIHTQVLGFGRMQTFTGNAYSSLSEQIFMAPGHTTSEAFCTYDANGKTVYPAHQYYADTDSLWLAIEYHPLKRGEK